MADGANGARPCLRHARYFKINRKPNTSGGVGFISSTFLFPDLHFEQIISLAEIICAREPSFFYFLS